MRDSQCLRDFSLSRRQDNTAPGSIALSFVNSIVKLPCTVFLPVMFVSETLVFSIFPSHDTLVVEGAVTVLKLIIAMRRISLIFDFITFIDGYPN